MKTKRKTRGTNYRYIGYSPLTPLQVKIGITNDLEDRLNAFHTTDHYMIFAATKRFNSRKAVFADEARLHRMFEHASSTRGNEWFHITPDLALWLLFQGAWPAMISRLVGHVTQQLTRIIFGVRV